MSGVDKTALICMLFKSVSCWLLDSVEWIIYTEKVQNEIKF